MDVDFTLLEMGTGENLTAGDLVPHVVPSPRPPRFLPHYEDQPLLFPSRAGGPGQASTWPSKHLDYIMLSGLSSSPNQLYYMPTKSGIPEKDKAEIRKWLDWGRKNIAYLKVRKDLPDWPAAGNVDGSAHVVGNQGLVFLFNSGKIPRRGEFSLTEEGIGLKAIGEFVVAQSIRNRTGQSRRYREKPFAGRCRPRPPCSCAFIRRADLLNCSPGLAVALRMEWAFDESPRLGSCQQLPFDGKGANHVML